MIKKKIPSPEGLKPEIRNGYPLDAEQIFEVQRDTWMATYANEELGITAEDIAERFNRGRDQRLDSWKTKLENGHKANNIWVAAINNEIIGFCTAHRGIEENQIGALYVLPKYQTQGIGGKLLKEALLWLENDRPVALGVVKYNAPAINFYRKHGFVDGPDIPQKECVQIRGKIIPEMKMIKKFE